MSEERRREEGFISVVTVLEDVGAAAAWGASHDFLHLLVFNSTAPLRWMSGLGMAGSFLAFLVGAYGVLINIFQGHVVEGWTSLVLFMSFLFMLLFMILAFFGEYLGRLLDERGDQREYAVAFEKTSAVMVDPNRLNVLQDSTGT